MKFDAVIGNPPYNRDIFLDFIEFGYILSNKYTTMITPAKWISNNDEARTAGDVNFADFRNRLIKKIYTVVFYPCCRDVFNISQTDGITYFIMDKTDHNEIEVINKCIDISYFNSESKRSICNRETLYNIGNEILCALPKYESFKFQKISGTFRYRVYAYNKISGYDWFETTKSRYLLGLMKVMDSKDTDELSNLSPAMKCIFESDNILECQSYKSYLETRAVRFLVMLTLSRMTGILNDDCFRFVPNQYNFNHTYTDIELYKILGIDKYPEYIEVIENTIKER
ncbi:MAG: Eco57I restriction-modification methylase domain-containing protein [Lachnospiraceae bacterium]|nr:Eco57I restriction-modification methylase domain-containing protein [Lachnospiraceae bacterium]